jgi:DNA replication licensing factor MCM7
MGDDVQALKLVKSIEENTKHYVEILSRAIDDCMPEPASEVTYVSILAPDEGERES